MERLYTIMQRLAAPLLRISLGIILLWIGALKFADPTPVVGLLQASLPFLASNAFVYLVGVLEVEAALRLPNSTGPVEGNINRLKLIKRSGYARAGFDLLHLRVLET
jgi:uncharacterized membrane protein